MENIFHEKYMKKCLTLAKKGMGKVAPNPMVGALLVDKNGKVVASGAHLKYGESHAEVNCINSYNGDFSNLTLYVSLEPCSHAGKTPPCTDLIIKKGIKKVVIATIDPNPKVAGKGVEILKKTGVEVIVGVLENEARELNKVFIKNITTKKPYVAIKTATTLDGKIATKSGSSKWITGELARGEVQKLRSSFDAILSGSGTILADNPSLNCRIKGKKSPTRIIFDRGGKVPLNSNVFIDDGVEKIWVTNKNTHAPKDTKILKFENFDKLLRDLYCLKIYSILIEAGAGLNSALIKEGRVDFLYQFIAPKILGTGISFMDGISPEYINDAKKLKNIQIKKFEPDILLTGEFCV